MKKNRNINLLLIIGVLLIFITGCNMNNFNNNSKPTLEKEVLTFAIETNKPNLTDHFPKKIKNNKIYFFSNPPSCPPTYECSKQYGEIFINVIKSDYLEELQKLLNGKIAYKTAYIDSNFIINLSQLKKDIFPVEKCNKLITNKLPIPYFESYNSGKGEKVVEKIVNGESYFDYKYTVPDDLQVFVIQAEAGDFWTVDCNEKRPESLKEWQHGYSKGFAISEKEDMLIYWTMIW